MMTKVDLEKWDCFRVESPSSSRSTSHFTLLAKVENSFHRASRI